MRLSKDLIAKPVITIDGGVRVGIVKDIYLDASFNSIVGIFLGQEGLLKRRAFYIKRSSLVVIGKDAILVKSSNVVIDSGKQKLPTDWVRRDRLYGRQIITPGGTKIGNLGDVILNEDHLVVGFSLSSVQVEGPVGDKRAIMREAILDIGSDTKPMQIDLGIAEKKVAKLK